MQKKLKKKLKPKKKSLGKYKSSLEKYCSDKLRESGIAFTYEEDKFLLMESFRFEHKYFKMTPKGKLMSDRSNSIQQPIRYTPDFVGKDSKWIIETKGYLPSHHDFPSAMVRINSTTIAFCCLVAYFFYLSTRI